MFFKIDASAFKANLKRNVKPNTWLFASHNGTTLVVHSWFAYAAIQNIHLGNSPGVHRDTWNIYPGCVISSLIFTDRPELMETTSDYREAGSVCGNNKEFEIFRRHFIVEPHALGVPNRETLLNTRRVCSPLGDLQIPDDFQKVIDYANQICAKAEISFK